MSTGFVREEEMEDLEDTQPLIVAEFSQGVSTQNFAENVENQCDILSLPGKQPVAFLKVNSTLKNIEKEYPLFGGSNFIGRLKSCQVYFHHIKISKKHACIEIEDDTHLIFDCDSLNKTKRKSQTLKPDVRYELVDGISLTFADVECSYSIKSTLKPASDRISQAPTITSQQKPLGLSLLSKCFTSGNESPDLLSQELEEVDDDDDVGNFQLESAVSLPSASKSKNFIVVEDSPAVSYSPVDYDKREENLNSMELSVVKETQSFQNAEASLRLNLTSSDLDSDQEREGSRNKKPDEETVEDTLTSLGGSSVERIIDEIEDKVRSDDFALQEILHGPSNESDCLLLGETAPFFDGTPIDIKNLRKRSILAALDLYSPGTQNDGEEETKKKKVSFEKVKLEPLVNLSKEEGEEEPSSAQKPTIETAAKNGRKTLRKSGKKSEIAIENNSLDEFLGQGTKRIRKKKSSKTKMGTVSQILEEHKEKVNRKSRKQCEENVEEKIDAQVVVTERQISPRRRETLKSTPVLLSTPKDPSSQSKGKATRKKIKKQESAESSDSVKEKPSRSRKSKSVEQNNKKLFGKRERSRKLDETGRGSESPKKKFKLEKSEFKIAFTGISEKNLKALTKIVTDVGSRVEDSLLECTHLVAEQVKRTAKFLCAVARGIPIISPEWLHKSESAGKFEDARSFLLVDKAAEENFGFRLRSTLDKAKSYRLFEGYSIFVTTSITKPPKEELAEIIFCAGGKLLPKFPTKRNSSSGKCFVISCDEDKKLWPQFEKMNLQIVSIEIILSGLLKHQLDFDKHLLKVS